MSFLTNCFIQRLINSSKKLSVSNVKWRSIEDRELTGYCSKITRLVVIYKDEEIEKTEYFVLKIPYNSELYELMRNTGVYEKEIYMYGNVLPYIHELLGEQNRIAAKYFGTDGYRAIILEDLCKRGYKIGSIFSQPLDLEVCNKCMEQLAKFHAASVKLNQINESCLVPMKGETLIAESMKLKTIGDKLVDRLDLALKTLVPEIVKRNEAKIEAYKKIFISSILDDLDHQQSSFNVLNHCDLWSNNLLLKRSSSCQKVEDIKFIDFQLCSWMNPAIDIMYLLITSSSYEVFENHIGKFLQIYINTLQETMDKLNCDCKYTLEELKKDIQARFSFCLCVTVYQLAIAKADNSNERTDIANMKSLYSESYKTLAQPWFDYLCGYICSK